ncbi:hypothetical protein Chor_001480, partial [Crotalus horridus]
VAFLLFDFRGDLFNFPSSQEEEEPSQTWQEQQKCVSLGGRQVPSSEPMAEEKAVGCAEVGEAMEVDVAPLQPGENQRAIKKSGPVGAPGEKTVPESGSSNGRSTQAPDPAGPMSAATQTASAATVEVGTSMACPALQQRSASVQTERDFMWRPGSSREASPCQKEEEFELPHPPAGRVLQRHVRTIREVRTLITRVITDVYYKDGTEVDRQVIEVGCFQLASSNAVDPTASSTISSRAMLSDVSRLEDP